MNMAKELRYSLRALLKSPGFTSVAVLCLTLGIGVNIAIFSLIDTVLLSPVPYRDLEEVVTLWQSSAERGDTNLVSPANFVDWKRRNRVFTDLAAGAFQQVQLTGGVEPELLNGYYLSANFFPLMGVRPELGRPFLAEEDRPGYDNVVLISHRLWQRRFAGDPGILGKALTLNGASLTVIGVMPPGFEYPDRDFDVWTPLAIDARSLAIRSQRLLHVVARLRPGVDIERARAEMSSIAQQLEREYPEANSGWGIHIVGLRERLIGNVEILLAVLSAASGFVLLIVCANLANLMLVRALGREHEYSIHVALGADRRRLVGKLVMEGALLAAVGGVLGLGLAFWATRGLVALFPATIANLPMPRVDEISLDGRVLLFTAALSMLTILLFALAPAVQVSRVNLATLIGESGRHLQGGVRGRRLRNLMVVSSVALSLLLLIGAGLMTKSFLTLQGGDLGFHTEGILTSQLVVPTYRYAELPQRNALFQSVVQRVRSLPGVESVGLVNYLPLSGWWGTKGFTVEGAPPPVRGQEPVANFTVIDEGYFATMGISVVRGRSFSGRERADEPKTIVINETLARRFWPRGNPVGVRLNLGTPAEPDWAEIVGVAADVRQFGPHRPPEAEIYASYRQVDSAFLCLVVRTNSAPERLAPGVRREIWAVDKDQPISYLRTMDDLAHESLAPQRVSMILIVLFAALAALLSAIGIYGVISYSVAQRLHEIGTRMALGAGRGDIIRLVMRQAISPALLGLLVGLSSSLVLNRAVASLLFDVKATDLAVLVSASAFLLLLTLFSFLVPALRAARLDPILALRHE